LTDTAASAHADPPGADQGCSPKKEVGTPKTRLRQRFTVTQNINSAVLKISYTAFQSSCNSGLTFARISVHKSGGSGGRVPPVEESGGRCFPASPPLEQMCVRFLGRIACEAQMRPRPYRERKCADTIGTVPVS